MNNSQRWRCNNTAWLYSMNFCFGFVARHNEGCHPVRLTAGNTELWQTGPGQLWGLISVGTVWHSGMFLMWSVWYSLSVWCQAARKLLHWEHQETQNELSKGRGCVCSQHSEIYSCCDHIAHVTHTHTHTHSKEKKESGLHSFSDKGLLSGGLENVTWLPLVAIRWCIYKKFLLCTSPLMNAEAGTSHFNNSTLWLSVCRNKVCEWWGTKRQGKHSTVGFWDNFLRKEDEKKRRESFLLNSVSPTETLVF